VTKEGGEAIMDEGKSLWDEIEAGSYDAADRPFDFVEEGEKTALICETDDAARENIAASLNDMGYQTTLPATPREALKNMRFHVYDVVVVNEHYGREDNETNAVLDYLENLAMGTRRQIFVALVSDTYRTLDNLAAFNRSVNVTINTKNLDESGKIISQGKGENDAFYHIFKDTLKKLGKI
jgi:CheY-like chemotaxis protein